MNRRGFLASAIAAILAPPIEPLLPAADVFTLEHLRSLKRLMQREHIEAEEYVAFLPEQWTGRIGRYEGVVIHNAGRLRA
jgi:hypothetical protein